MKGRQKKVGLVTLTDFKPKKDNKKQRQYKMIKERIHQEDVTVINKHAPNIGAPKYIKHLLTDPKVEIDSNTIIVADFNTPFT